MQIESKQQILERRKEIEQELTELIKKIGGNFSAQDIKNVIYNENNSKDFNDLVMKFYEGQDLDELNKNLRTVSDAWNYFPHKVLGDISPAEKILEYQNKYEKK